MYGSVESFDALDENTGRSTPRLSPPKKESAGAPYRSTRFGFRLNRPNSTGVAVSQNLSCDNVNNNNSDIKPNGKILPQLHAFYIENEPFFCSVIRGVVTTDITLMI